MKLPVAIGLGAVTAVALPYAFRDSSGQLADMIANSSHTFYFGGISLHFSLAIFLVVTLFSWAFFVWSDK